MNLECNHQFNRDYNDQAIYITTDGYKVLGKCTKCGAIEYDDNLRIKPELKNKKLPIKIITIKSGL